MLDNSQKAIHPSCPGDLKKIKNKKTPNPNTKPCSSPTLNIISYYKPRL
jgi:hypothetical protein